MLMDPWHFALGDNLFNTSTLFVFLFNVAFLDLFLSGISPSAFYETKIVLLPFHLTHTFVVLCQWTTLERVERKAQAFHSLA
jgi:hypothetical protein